MKIEIDTVKGFQDILPPESLKRKAVQEVIEKYYKLYGFLPVETPIVEFDELMKPDMLEENPDEAVSDRFKLKDRAGRNLGLRYEFTFQLARIFKQNPNIKLPFRRYQIGPNFRDEPIGPGRFRQFTQCDADIIGDSSIEADAECLAMISEILKELQIEAKIEVNNRKLLNSIIESVQVEGKNIKNIMREIDKIGKLDEDAIKANLRKYADANQIITLFRLLDKPLSFFVENAFDGAEEMRKLEEICKKYSINIKFNPYLARGLSYYTGNIFEIKSQNATIGAGGRYDKVVGKYLEKEIPAVGISFGLERVTQLASIKTEGVKVIVISIDQEKNAITLARKLRKENIPTILSTDKPGKSLEYANAYSIPFAVFIGREEVEQKKFKLKNLASGEEKMLTDKQLIKSLN